MFLFGQIVELILVTAMRPRERWKDNRQGTKYVMREFSIRRQPPTGVVFNILARDSVLWCCVFLRGWTRVRRMAPGCL